MQSTCPPKLMPLFLPIGRAHLLGMLPKSNKTQKIGRAVPSAPRTFQKRQDFTMFANPIGALGTARPTLRDLGHTPSSERRLSQSISITHPQFPRLWLIGKTDPEQSVPSCIFKAIQRLTGQGDAAR